MLTLSKSDYKLACSCPKKLHYKKQKYPSNLEDNEFMKMLSEGGYVVGKLAQLLYPGIEITEDNMDGAIAKTAALLEQDEITIHEAAIKFGQKIVRIDILKKQGNNFQLIEVKAKSYNSKDPGDFTGKADKPLPNKTKDYLKDAIFQTIVLQEVYPNATIDTYLCMPDKSVLTSVEGLPSLFSVRSTEPKTPGGFRKIEVSIREKKAVDAILDKIKDEQLLGLLKLNDQVKTFRENVINDIEQFINLLNSDFKDYRPLLNKECKKCEFRGNQINTKDGFKECWGAMAEVDPHIFDLYYGGDLGEKQLLNEKISNKTVSLWDIKESELVKKDNTIGTRNKRQLIQYEHTKFKTEWPNDEINQKVFASNLSEQFQYPLHFIDFETMSSALPFHKGLTPYDMFPFQWSVHTIKSEGAEPVHKEFINTEEGYPGFRFAETLMDCIGDSGTPLMWSPHENTTLNQVLKHMSILEYQNETLKTWLLEITKVKDNRPGRLVDMNDFTLKNYFHPEMKGRTSIKVTLPAIWNNHPYLHQIPWFSEWVLKDENGTILDPYLKLKNLKELWGFEPSVFEEEEEEESYDTNYVVKDGGAAMKAYQDMIFTTDNDKKEKLKIKLLKYCQLDTLAMVIIFEHWKTISQKI